MCSVGMRAFPATIAGTSMVTRKRYTVRSGAHRSIPSRQWGSKSTLVPCKLSPVTLQGLGRLQGCAVSLGWVLLWSK
jgi:hypothetical protein